MTDTPYNMPPLGLFGKRCRILTGYDKRLFVYRIVNSKLMSNTWCEPPITYQSEKNPVRHDHSENVLIVVLDTLIDDNSRLIRVALKDVELMDEAPTVGGWISVKDRLPEKQKIMIATLAYQHSSNYVLIYIDGISWPYNRKLITIGRYDYDESRWVVRNAFRGEVTHWMPLPEPPKEEE